MNTSLLLSTLIACALQSTIIDATFFNTQFNSFKNDAHLIKKYMAKEKMSDAEQKAVKYAALRLGGRAVTIIIGTTAVSTGIYCIGKRIHTCCHGNNSKKAAPKKQSTPSHEENKKTLLTAKALKVLDEIDTDIDIPRIESLLNRYKIAQVDQANFLTVHLKGDHKTFKTLCDKYQKQDRLRDAISFLYEAQQDIAPEPTEHIGVLYDEVINAMREEFSGWKSVESWEDREVQQEAEKTARQDSDPLKRG